MITYCIKYTLDPHELAAFKDNATRWPPIIERCGRQLTATTCPRKAPATKHYGVTSDQNTCTSTWPLDGSGSP